ncbi:hypothetical protein G4X40_05965 [Rhodococcus sp. D2-41]|uniref:glycosyltransferase family 87 protein n=1 Tax=Speluncibacter jeojiensis TaxID=2710754 RepID=UPI00240F6D04|nr:hypothetical protein [Rhodococcus sp. D2-41]MDG3009690.1 hypothetical protein [Rhodococcus sp. D2-41]
MPATSTAPSDRRVTGTRTGKALLVLIVVLCGVTLALGYSNKARCAGPPYDSAGRSLAFGALKNRDVCYSDIQFLWLGRDIDEHVFPYVHGGITAGGQLFGGTVEYPVLTGVLMWAGAIGAHDDAAYLAHSALLLAGFGLITAWMLGWLSGVRALLWSLGPPLVLYAFHNWDLPVVATTVGAVFVMAAGRGGLRTRSVIAAVLLGIGVCLKLYPGLLVAPLALYVLVGGTDGRELPASVRGRYDVRGALAAVAAAVATTVAINLPFAVAGARGWWASFTFQSDRAVDITTNSIWYWGLRPLFADTPSAQASFQHVVDIASPLLVILGCLLALALGWHRFRREGSYPWIAVGGAMLCAFLLLHKVDSPQYMLWLLPFFVLVRVPWPVVTVYLLADLSLGIGLFRYFDALQRGNGHATGLEQLVWFGVWGRAACLVILFVLFTVRRPAVTTAAWSREPAASVT